MRDFLGNELEIGDEVIGVLPNYREFVRGFVIAFTPQRVRIEYQTGIFKRVLLQDPSQLIVVNKIRR
jgi:hypothetical protein